MKPFDNFIGYDNVKDELSRIVEFTFLYDTNYKTNPAAPFPNRILLVGPPGTGKSYLARLTTEYFYELSTRYNKSVSVIYLNTSFKNKYYGESEKNIRRKFLEFNDLNKISLMILEEIDTLFSSRFLYNNPTDNSILGEVLQGLEGLVSENYYNNILISTTNVIDLIDDALLQRISSKVFYLRGFDNIDDYVNFFHHLTRKYNIDDICHFNDDLILDFSKKCYKFKLTPRDTKKIAEEFFFKIKLYNLERNNLSLKDGDNINLKQHLYNCDAIDLNRILNELFQELD